MRIGTLDVNKNSKPIFIADIASNHDGSIERAYRLIELAKEAGADIAKFQNFKAELIVSRNGFDSMPKQSHQAQWEKSVYQVYQEASVCDEWTIKLKEKCDEVGIEYMTSPYDHASVDWALPYVGAFKIGSGDITWLDIIEYMAKKEKPILLATGAATLEEVKRAVDIIEKYNKDLVLLQCNTNYTADLENFNHINLNVLKQYELLYPKCILGLSDHTPGHVAVLGAIALGACVIEKHFTDDNTRMGPDHKFAMNPQSWRKMVDDSMTLWKALGDGNKKVEKNELESRKVQQRSLFLTKSIGAGQIIQNEDLIPLRPIMDDGIPPYAIAQVVGKKAKRDLKVDTYVKWEDLLE